MSDERFTIDTNILVYSVDNRAGERHQRAMEIIDRAVERDCWLTLQALSEFFVAATRKDIMPRAIAASQLDDWLKLFPCAAASASAVRNAAADSAAGRASYRDALLVATAAEAGCASILTEDLSDGAALGTLRIVNPFSPDGGLTDTTRRLLALE
jgi:predicted nucleic acid-binding protein